MRSVNFSLVEQMRRSLRARLEGHCNRKHQLQLGMTSRNVTLTYVVDVTAANVLPLFTSHAPSMT